MDLLKEGMKNISLYEVKKQVRKAQNVVLNYSEMEAKVREATNNEPWGTSSAKMQEIAAGTFNYKEREEICGMIFRRFTEKTANEWRQIYKALILLEYLVKHGSERFVDDAIANMSLISMLKSFHYIDSQGRDQGLNVRNRAKLLLELLNDKNKIRAERKKARKNEKKFKGLAGGTRLGGGGYDSDDGYSASFGGGSTDIVYGDGGVYGARFEEQRSATKDEFEEYDVPTVSTDSAPRPPRTNRPVRSGGARRTGGPDRNTGAAAASSGPDLVSFDDDDFGAPVTAPSKAPAPVSKNDDDDDFADFQEAAPVTQAQPAVQSNFDLLSGLSSSNTTSTTPAFTSTATTTPSFFSTPQPQAAVATASSSSNDAFSSLFSTAKATIPHKPAATTNTINNDFFGAAPTASATSTSTTQKSNANDLDLLSL